MPLGSLLLGAGLLVAFRSRAPPTTTGSATTALASSPAFDDDLVGIDDWNATGCASMDAFNDSAACSTADDEFCAIALESGDTGADARGLLRWLGCDSCDGEFAPCLFVRLAGAQKWCDRLARNESLWTDAVTAGSIDRRERRRVLGARSGGGGSAPAPTPLPTFDTDDTTACDSKAYCEECAPYDTCKALLHEAHAGNISGIVPNTQDMLSNEYWHAGQAFDMVVSFHYVCRFAREAGIIAPPKNASHDGGPIGGKGTESPS